LGACGINGTFIQVIYSGTATMKKEHSFDPIAKEDTRSEPELVQLKTSQWILRSVPSKDWNSNRRNNCSYGALETVEHISKYESEG
jgi:hypothetical protein